ncbi:MAG: polyphosphate--nucleotide phosphotransferase [Bacteroidetes bacterium B1(2017)]|nr:MAG: polyphosphate--nucleotide phosphotransferase [Bacteroidetes bacterium B1(2017)]
MIFKKEMQKYLQTLQVKEGKKVSLKKFDTDFENKLFTKQEGEEILQHGLEQLALLQDKLFAENKHSVLIVLQAMDAAGKDGVIKHVMKGFNPQGVKVASFKAPSHLELNHDYFWRHYLELPGKGEIGIFNRSHYENVLVTRVHPEYILNEKIPGIKKLKDIDSDFWEERFKQINRFEKNLSENGTLILKFFLHLSKDEQKKRFLDRIEKPEKNWKFSMADANERQHWDKYMKAYEEMLSATSTEHAPWYILPADDKWFTRICLGTVVYLEFEKLKLKYPKVSEEQLAEIQKAKAALLAEED